MSNYLRHTDAIMYLDATIKDIAGKSKIWVKQKVTI